MKRRSASGPGVIAGAEPTGSVLYLAALPWDYRFQRPQQLALALTAHRLAVLYVEAFDRGRMQPAIWARRITPALQVLSLRLPGRPDPFREPFPGPAAARLAREIVAGVALPPSLLLVQLPFWLPLARELHALLGCPWVYDRIDLHAGFPGVPAAVSEAEEGLLREVDLVAASSRDLATRSRTAARQVLTVPNGVVLEDFSFHPEPLRREPRILWVGYVGALGHWFDSEAVARAAVAQPDWQFLLAGHVEDAAVAELGLLPNVVLVGEIPYGEVGAFLADLDVALVPFRDLPLTRAVDPVKLYEAFAVGLPVVARKLPELARWPEPWVFLYEDPADLEAQILRARHLDAPDLRGNRRRAASQETWGHRAETLLVSVGGRPDPVPRAEEDGISGEGT